MKATATKGFSALFGGRELRCRKGDAFEADAKTFERLEAMGLATVKTERAKPRKAEEND